MGPNAFAKYLAFIRAMIGSLKQTIAYLVMREEELKKVEGNADDTGSASKLENTRQQLAELGAQMSALKAFYVQVVKQWSKLDDRVIGHVVWAPKISTSVPPYGYTPDFCVIHLDKKKFKDGFLGNALSLG